MELWIVLAIIAVAAGAYYIWRQAKEAQDFVNETIEDGSLFEDASPDLSYQMGLRQMDRGNVPDAIAAFRRAEASGHEDAAQNLAQLLEQRGDIDEAIQVYERNLARGYSPAAIDIALIRADQGKYEEAIENVNVALNGGVFDKTGSIAKLVEEWRSKIPQ